MRIDDLEPWDEEQAPEVTLAGLLSPLVVMTVLTLFTAFSDSSDGDAASGLTRAHGRMLALVGWALVGAVVCAACFLGSLIVVGRLRRRFSHPSMSAPSDFDRTLSTILRALLFKPLRVRDGLPDVPRRKRTEAGVRIAIVAPGAPIVMEDEWKPAGEGENGEQVFMGTDRSQFWPTPQALRPLGVWACSNKADERALDVVRMRPLSALGGGGAGTLYITWSWLVLALCVGAIGPAAHWYFLAVRGALMWSAIVAWWMLWNGRRRAVMPVLGLVVVAIVVGPAGMLGYSRGVWIAADIFSWLITSSVMSCASGGSRSEFTRVA